MGLNQPDDSGTDGSWNNNQLGQLNAILVVFISRRLTRVGVGDLVGLVGIQPDLLLAAAQDAGGQPLLEPEHATVHTAAALARLTSTQNQHHSCPCVYMFISANWFMFVCLREPLLSVFMRELVWISRDANSRGSNMASPLLRRAEPRCLGTCEFLFCWNTVKTFLLRRIKLSQKSVWGSLAGTLAGFIVTFAWQRSVILPHGCYFDGKRKTWWDVPEPTIMQELPLVHW